MKVFIVLYVFIEWRVFRSVKLYEMLIIFRNLKDVKRFSLYIEYTEIATRILKNVLISTLTYAIKTENKNKPKVSLIAKNIYHWKKNYIKIA